MTPALLSVQAIMVSYRRYLAPRQIAWNASPGFS
jgi:hypothetical protein